MLEEKREKATKETPLTTAQSLRQERKNNSSQNICVNVSESKLPKEHHVEDFMLTSLSREDREGVGPQITHTSTPEINWNVINL